VNVNHTPSRFPVGDFDVGVLAAIFGQDLDAEVNVFVGGQAAVVAVDLTKKNDGGSAGSFGLGGHLQFVRGDRLKAYAPRRNREDEDKD
jgi:hypothetical protein